MKLFTVDWDLRASETLCYWDYCLLPMCWLDQPKEKNEPCIHSYRAELQALPRTRTATALICLPTFVNFVVKCDTSCDQAELWEVHQPNRQCNAGKWLPIISCVTSDGHVMLLARYLQSCNFLSRLSNQIPSCHSRELLGLEVVHFVRYAKMTILK